MAVAAVLVVTALTVIAVGRRDLEGSASRASQRSTPVAVLELRSGERLLLRVPVSRYSLDGRIDSRTLARIVRSALPSTVVASRARARITYAYDTGATVRRARRAGLRGGRVEAVRRPVAATVSAPVVPQARRNPCESAALEILLATVGRRVDQRRLQAAFPRSGPLDPRGSGPQEVWGDPDEGYVGRPDGGGVAGGYGIYPRPVRATARQFGVRLVDLSGRSPRAVYDQLLAGRAVMAWVGLSSGPYGQWRTPGGRSIKVNFGEHTVVLHGLRRDGQVLVSNPLKGTRETWTKERFQTMWRLLGRRALGA